MNSLGKVLLQTDVREAPSCPTRSFPDTIVSVSVATIMPCNKQP